jgi:hypothetical protein
MLVKRNESVEITERENAMMVHVHSWPLLAEMRVKIKTFLDGNGFEIRDNLWIVMSEVSLEDVLKATSPDVEIKPIQEVQQRREELLVR